MFHDTKREPAKDFVPALEAGTQQAVEASSGGEDRGSVILVVGGDETFSRELARFVEQESRTVAFARGGADAEKLVGERHVVLIVLRTVLPDVDARDFFVRLREHPRTAAVPVLFLGERIVDSVKKHRCRMEADGDMEGAPTAEEVAAWIRGRLRRVREVVRDARRDALTALPNRAAFCEEYPRVAEGCREGREPMVLALVACDACGSAGSADGGKTGGEISMLLSSTLSACLRATDIVARWSQNEFVALLPGEHQAGGQRAMEKVLAAWRKRSTPTEGGEVTISAGLIAVEPGVPLNQAILLAGRHLQSARADGGNRVATSRSMLPWRRGRVLLVVHDNVISEVLVNLLEREDLKTVLVGNADEAVKACSGRWRFQLIMIDEEIPGQDGLEILAVLKNLPRNQSVPFMMLLKEHSEAQVARVLQMGVHDFTVRPFDPLAVVSRVRDLLAQSMGDRSDASTTCRVMVVDEDTNALILAGTALHRCGGVEVYLCLDTEDAVRRLREESIDIMVVPLPMLEKCANNMSAVLGTPSTDSSLAIVAAVTEAAPDPEALRKLGCRGAIKRPFNPLTIGEELFRLVGIRPGGRSVVFDNGLSAEIRRVVQNSRSGRPAQSR